MKDRDMRESPAPEPRTPPPGDLESTPRLVRPSMLDRRTFLRGVTAGTVVMAMGGATYVRADDAAARRAAATPRPDGRPKLPPGQFLLSRLRPMGGVEGDPSPGKFRLRVSGEVEQPFEVDFAELLKM